MLLLFCLSYLYAITMDNSLAFHVTTMDDTDRLAPLIGLLQRAGYTTVWTLTSYLRFLLHPLDLSGVLTSALSLIHLPVSPTWQLVHSSHGNHYTNCDFSRIPLAFQCTKFTTSPSRGPCELLYVVLARSGWVLSYLFIF